MFIGGVPRNQTRILVLTMQSFPSVSAAIDKGWVVATKGKQYQAYKGCAIICTSSTNTAYGHEPLALRAQVPDIYTRNFLGVTSDLSFGISEEVSVLRTDKPNGAVAKLQNEVVLMFAPRMFEEALAEAQAWVNRWFQYNPQAMERAMIRRREMQEKQRAVA